MIVDTKTHYDMLIKEGNDPVHDPLPLREYLNMWDGNEFISQRLKSLFAGEATDKKLDGADWHLRYSGKLPEYYISKTDAMKLGWNKNHKKLSDVAPGYMMYGEIYRNKNSHLPDKKGRIWYEADIDYEFGHRNTKRIVFSNDGLIFITYDHYQTFIEVR